jgi:hypothetical protein
MAWDGQHYHMIELSQDAIAHRIAQADAALEFAESLTLLPAEGIAGIRADARELFEDIDAAFADTILAAQGHCRVFLCDDRPLRLLAHEVATVHVVWTQAIAAHAHLQRKLSQEAYSDIVGALVEAGYVFTMINRQNLIDALGRSKWSRDARVRAIIDSLTQPNNEPVSVTHFVAELMFFGWREKPNSDAYVQVLAAIFSGFKRNHPSLDLQSLVEVSYGLVHQSLRARIWRSYKQKLLTTTSEQTPEALADSVKSMAGRLASQIAEAIGVAGRQAGGWM